MVAKSYCESPNGALGETFCGDGSSTAGSQKRRVSCYRPSVLTSNTSYNVHRNVDIVTWLGFG